ncbi:NACHT domain-containing protein [Phytohabitans sp. LJ34]|uniref:NACHT domain-containing protein n=1 Tax=Phytohabitans sp. LJ34 TaxID=3452217 RepID=UPI003F8C637D
MALEEWIALGGLVVAVAGVVVAVLQWRSGRPAPPPRPAARPPVLPALLRAQRAYAGALPYLAALGGAAPELAAVYVTLRAGRIERAAAVAGPPDQGKPPAEPRVTEVDLAEVVSAPGGAVLVGGAGSGKSTVVSRVVAEAAERWLAAGEGTPGPAGLPLVVPARLLGPSADLHRAVAAGLARTARLAEDDLSALLAAAPPGGGHWLVVVDGLDEVVDAGERRDVVRRLAMWLADPGAPHRIVVTTRPPREGELAPLRAAGATEFHLRPFDVDGLAVFARRWFAAVHPNGGDLAGRFLARVAADRLGGLVRTPLLATIAAVVFGRSLDQPLPAGRASLYEAYVDLSLRRRRSPRDVAESDPDDPRARVWRGDPSGQALLWELFLHTEDLLRHLADRRLAGDPAPLAGIATTWVTDVLGDGDRARRLVAADPAWAHLVPALLAETGLVGPAGADAEFTHPSFTEYLAARHRALGMPESLAAVDDGATRGFGLFAVAAAVRREPAAAATVEALLDGDHVDLRTLAEILADGVPLDPAFQRRAAADIVARCREAGRRYGSFRHEETVAAVAAHPFAADRLAAVAGSADEPAGFRGTAARLLAAAGRPEAVEALLPALDDTDLTAAERATLAEVTAGLGTGPVAARGLDTLRALAGGDQEDWAAHDAAVALAEHGTHADRAGLLARATEEGSSYWRVLVAAALARHGDAAQRTGAVHVLDGLLTDDILAVAPFAEYGGPDARRRLAAVAADRAVAPGIRRAAVGGMLRFAGPDERESIVDTVRGLLNRAEESDRGPILVDLVAHGPGADQAAAFARDPSVGTGPRGMVAVALLRDGAAADRGVGFDVLRAIARDANVRAYEREEALRALATYGGPPGLAAVAEAVGAADPPDVRLAAARGLALHGDPVERATGRRSLTALVEAGRPPEADPWDIVPGHAAVDLAEYGTAADRAWLAQLGADAGTTGRLRGQVLDGLFRFGTGGERAAARTLMERLVRDAGDDWVERGLVAKTLVQSGGPPERRTLRRWAADGGLASGTRYRAAEALADDGGPADLAGALRAFAELLDDPAADPVVRHFAARDLYQHGGAAERADLERRAQDRSADPRARVVAAAGVMRSREGAAARLAAGVLASLAADPDLDVEMRLEAAQQLVEHGDREAHDAAIHLAGDPVLRLGVAQAFLTTMRPVTAAHEAAAAGHLAALLRESTMRADDSQFMADLLVRAAKAVDTALELSRDPAVPEDNRLSAAYALYSADHYDALVRLAGDGALAPAVRIPVARWLAGEDEGPRRAAGLAALESIVTDRATTGDGRELAVGALRRHFDNAAEVLTRLATAPAAPVDTRCAAAAALAEHGTDGLARHGAEVLADLAANGPTWWVRLHAVLGIQLYATGVPVPTGAGTHPVVRAFAARHVANEGDPEGLAVLRAMLGDPAAPDEARALAVAMLVAAGEPAVGVEAMSAPDTTALVRAAAATALAEDDSTADEGALETLARLAVDRSAPDDVRAAAVTFLSRRDRLAAAMRIAPDPDASGLPRLAAATALLAAGVPGAAELVHPEEPGGRLWLWALAALNQYGDEADRDVDLVAAIRYFADEVGPGDPLVRHLTTTGWYDYDDPPLDCLRQELVGVLMTIDGDPELWRESAREVTRHGDGYERLLARAVLRETDPAAAVELDKTA